MVRRGSTVQSSRDAPRQWKLARLIRSLASKLDAGDVYDQRTADVLRSLAGGVDYHGAGIASGQAARASDIANPS